MSPTPDLASDPLCSGSASPTHFSPGALESPVHSLGSPSGEGALIPASGSAALEGISGLSSGLVSCSSRV